MLTQHNSSSMQKTQHFQNALSRWCWQVAMQGLHFTSSSSNQKCGSQSALPCCGLHAAAATAVSGRLDNIASGVLQPPGTLKSVGTTFTLPLLLLLLLLLLPPGG
jgi:hypothetical protein